jgi:hypothetical protein
MLSTAVLHCGALRATDHLLVLRGFGMKRLVTRTGAVGTAQMDGYLIEERLLDRIMIQVSDRGGGSLEIAFHERDQRFLSQFSDAQHAHWLGEAMLHIESGCALETPNGEPAWVTDEAPPRSTCYMKTMRPARQEFELPPGLDFLKRTCSSI